MIVIEGTIRVGDLEKARPHMMEMIRASRAEKGCIDYTYAADVVDQTLIRVIERWESRETLEAHTKTAHIAKWRDCWPVVGISDRSLRLYEADAEEF